MADEVESSVFYHEDGVVVLDWEEDINEALYLSAELRRLTESQDNFEFLEMRLMGLAFETLDVPQVSRWKDRKRNTDAGFTVTVRSPDGHSVDSFYLLSELKEQEGNTRLLTSLASKSSHFRIVFLVNKTMFLPIPLASEYKANSAHQIEFKLSLKNELRQDIGSTTMPIQLFLEGNKWKLSPSVASKSPSNGSNQGNQMKSVIWPYYLKSDTKSEERTGKVFARFVQIESNSTVQKLAAESMKDSEARRSKDKMLNSIEKMVQS